MDTVFLVLTGLCPRECPFCFYRTGYLEHPRAEMSTDEVRRAISKARELGTEGVIFTGGEPLSRPDFLEIARAAGRLGLRRLLLTGGSLLDSSRIDLLLRERLEGIAVSVNSLREAEELDVRAEGLREFPPGSVTVSTVFHRDNLRDLAPLIAWAGEWGRGMVIQPAFIPRESSLYPRLSPGAMSQAEWDELSGALRIWAGPASAGRYLGYLHALYRGGSARPTFCGMGGRSFVVDCDGSVYPCFHRRDLTSGDIRTDRIAALRESLARSAGILASAPCYGEHCVSLFAGE